MTTNEPPKPTSFGYGSEYQQRQAKKYRDRDARWNLRIELAQRLLADYAAPRLSGKPPTETVVVDVGCSIGTYAIELAKSGYRTYGIDFDPEAIRIARELAAEAGVSAEFVCGDVAEWRAEFPPIDVAVCFDIFEHLHDDELGAFLAAVRKQLAPNACLIYHTCPTEFRHLFLGGSKVAAFPLLPFVWMPERAFTAVARSYATALDAVALLFTGKNRRDRIRKRGHCNPTTKARLNDILQRAGFESVLTETAPLYPGKRAIERFVQNAFSRKTIGHNNLYGVAVLRGARDASE